MWLAYDTAISGVSIPSMDSKEHWYHLLFVRYMQKERSPPS